MILNKFFKAKWQHKNPTIRIEAIADLNADIPADFKVLTQLINDEVFLVRKSALLRLDKFTVWFDNLQNHPNADTREFCQKQLEKQLQATEQSVLTAENKIQFIVSGKARSVVDYIANNEAELAVIKQLVKQYNKPNIIQSIVINNANIEVKRFALDLVTELSALEKLSKRKLPQTITEQIDQRISALKTAAQKPLLVEKEAKMVLAKLQALKDSSDYQIMSEKKSSLESQWQQLVLDFDSLNNATKQTFEEKFTAIQHQLTKTFAAEYEKYQQQLIAIELANKQHAFEQDIKQRLSTITTQITDAVFNNIELDIDQVSQQLSESITHINQSELDANKQQELVDAVNKLLAKLDRLPLVAESVAQATHLISKLSNLSLPNDVAELNEKLPIFRQWQQDWRSVEKQASGVLPESIVSAYQELNSRWSTHIKPIIAQQNKQLHLVQKTMADIKRLINIGKFYPAMGVYKKLTQQVNLLTDKQQSQIERELEQVTKKVEELNDWQSYIAAPRKKELLEQAASLAIAPMDNLLSQAHEVKLLRKQWNSLGNVENSDAVDLNNRFNLLLEQAFMPCREYFQAQEDAREQHLIKRKEVIELAKQLFSNTSDELIDVPVLEIEINRILNAWRDAGEVERGAYKLLSDEFNHYIKPLKAKVKAFQFNNAKLKQEVIAKAKALSEQENVFDAIEELKQLQSTWQQIGFAGQKKENALWREFRQFNDITFEKRQQVLAQQNEQRSAVVAEIATTFEALKQQSLDHVKVIHETIEQAKSLLKTLESQRIHDKKIVHEVKQFIADCNDKLAQVKSDVKKQQFDNVFRLFMELSEGNITLESLENNSLFQQLKPTWQKSLISAITSTADESEREKTVLELEILAGVESPAELNQQRMEIQVAMLADKLTESKHLSIETSFNHLIASGLMKPINPELIKRVNAVISAQV